MVKGSGFPLIPGKWMVTGGTFKKVNAIRAFEETTIEITAMDGSVAEYILTERTDTSISFPNKGVEVISGLASIADNTVA